MNPSYIEHIGIAVKELDSAVKLYEDLLGIKCYKIEEVPDQKVRTAFFRIGETKIELLESIDPEGPISKFIDKRGEGLHHIAFAVKELEEQLKKAKKANVRLINEIPQKGADGLDIAFIHPKSTSGVLIELCEDKTV
ncbi:MAG: methylmalonyl-CoA epimerase [Bacteroidales bacterium]|nr:methylmalonyl-CoA epimerase [Bacteroidales bacterium]